MNNNQTAPISYPTTGTVNSAAHRQWASRAKDEKFQDIYDLITFLGQRKNRSTEREIPFDQLRVTNNDTDIRLISPAGQHLELTHHSFNQLAIAANLSVATLRKSFEAFERTADAADWVARGLGLGLKWRKNQSKTGKLLIHVKKTDEGNTYTLQSITTDKYKRVWDVEIAQQILIPLAEHGFVNPPCWDGWGGGFTNGGLYASDRDMFALMLPRNVRRINMPGVQCDLCREPFEVNGQLFSPFLMLSHSEVGDGPLKFSSGLVQGVCANLNLYGVEGLTETVIHHKGEPMKKLMELFTGFMNQWVKKDCKEEASLIQAAMRTNYGKTVEDAKELLTIKAKLTVDEAAAAIATIEGGNKSTGIISQDVTNLWNMVAAITANARLVLNQNDQVALVKQAGKLMALVGN